MRNASYAVLLGALLVLLLSPAQGTAAGSKQIIALLNTERSANGIPAGITENPAWSAACRQHNAYEAKNRVFGHVETEGKPGYSREGNLIAATSVLAQGIQWGSGDPYDNAPYHLFDLLNPRISSTGAADSEGFGCVEILLGTQRPVPGSVQIYSYPGNGRRNVPYAQKARELPESPAQTLGLGTRPTGPNLLLYVDGPWSNGSRAQLTGARLRSSRGSVALRWLDNTTSNLLAPTGAILVPVVPLRPATRYQVSVEGTVQGVHPGTTTDQALAGSCTQQPDGSVSCGQPPTSCVEDFATLQAVCGLSESWPFKQSWSFTTRRKR
ncbi:MAG: CAP domain-containing protein [Solirubrobacteraceae bacterium]